MTEKTEPYGYGVTLDGSVSKAAAALQTQYPVTHSFTLRDYATGEWRKITVTLFADGTEITKIEITRGVRGYD